MNLVLKVHLARTAFQERKVLLVLMVILDLLVSLVLEDLLVFLAVLGFLVQREKE